MFHNLPEMSGLNLIYFSYQILLIVVHVSQTDQQNSAGDGWRKPYKGNQFQYNTRPQYYNSYNWGDKSTPVSCTEGKVIWVRDPDQCNKAWFCKTVKGKYEYKYEVCPDGKIVPEGKHDSFKCENGNLVECNKKNMPGRQKSIRKSTKALKNVANQEKKNVNTTLKPFWKRLFG